MDYHRYRPMTRMTHGLTPTCRLSVWLAGYLGYPQGWSLCGIIGLTTILYPWVPSVAPLIDFFTDTDHCYYAVHRSIERVKHERGISG